MSFASSVFLVENGDTFLQNFWALFGGLFVAKVPRQPLIETSDFAGGARGVLGGTGGHERAVLRDFSFESLDGQNRQSPIASDFGSRTQIAALFRNFAVLESLKRIANRAFRIAVSNRRDASDSNRAFLNR